MSRIDVRNCAREAFPGPFVELLRTTPVDTVCPNFHALDHARGCAFAPRCSYCYLNDPYYGRGRAAVADNKDELFAQVRAWLAQDGLETHVANAGNLSDSFAFEAFRPLMGELVDLFREEAEAKGLPHTLLLVTKGGQAECETLFARRPTRNVIVSFSVNHPDAQRDHERGAADIPDRLAAARRLADAGWRVRVRLDPMIHGYDYRRTADDVAELAPERVTLGTLRADPSMYPYLPAALRTDLPPPPPEAGERGLARYPWAMRLALYRVAAERLWRVCSLGLCEETPAMWQALGFDADHASCNCEGHPGHRPGFAPRAPDGA